MCSSRPADKWKLGISCSVHRTEQGKCVRVCVRMCSGDWQARWLIASAKSRSIPLSKGLMFGL